VTVETSVKVVVEVVVLTLVIVLGGSVSLIVLVDVTVVSEHSVVSGQVG
jgi:hypothetical protein